MKWHPPIFLSFCLLVCALLIALWVRSCFVFDVVARGYAGGNYYEYATLPAQFRFTVAYGWPYELPRLRLSSHRPPATMDVFGQYAIYQKWYPAGFAMHANFRKIGIPLNAPGSRPGVRSTIVYYRTFAIPFATPLFVAAAYPAWWAFTGRRRRRRTTRLQSAGLCPDCGYDLRASQQVCPECGRAVEKSTTNA